MPTRSRDATLGTNAPQRLPASILSTTTISTTLQISEQSANPPRSLTAPLVSQVQKNTSDDQPPSSSSPSAPGESRTRHASPPQHRTSRIRGPLRRPSFQPDLNEIARRKKKGTGRCCQQSAERKTKSTHRRLVIHRPQDVLARATSEPERERTSVGL